MVRLRPLALALLLAALPARAQDGGAFTIAGIDVDVAAKSPQAARSGGWRQAQRLAWPQLWSRLTGAPAANAPKLADNTLDAVVQAIEVEREAVGPTRYIARLSVVFDRARASKYLGASARMLRSSPMLIIPVQIDAATRIAVERRTDWSSAWARFPTDSSPVDYIRPAGTAADAVTLNAWAVYRPDRPRWRAALARYAAADVLVAEATLTRAWPGGPVGVRVRALHGPDLELLGVVTLAATSETELAAVLDSAVRRIDELYTAALREGRLRADEDLTVALNPVEDFSTNIGATTGFAGSASLDVDIDTPTSEAAAELERRIRTAAGVVSTRLSSAAFGGTSRLTIGYEGDPDSLRYALDGVGLRLEGVRLRPRRPDEAPLPPPAPPAPATPPGAATEAVPETETADAPPPPAQ